jgi:hypothetical protein
VFELAEEALDAVALATDVMIEDAANADIALRGDVCGRAGRLDQGDDRGGKIAAVGDGIGGRLQFVKQGRGQPPDRTPVRRSGQT